MFLPQRNGIVGTKPPYDRMDREERRRAMFELDKQRVFEFNEKDSVKAVSGFPSRPSDFEEVIGEVLGGIGDDPSRLKGGVERLGMLVDEVRALCTEDRSLER